MPTIETKTGQTTYFLDDDYLADNQRRRTDELPPEQKSLRNNVEVIVKKFKNGKQHGKLRVRGRIKTEFFAYSKAIRINFGRMDRYLLSILPDVAMAISAFIALVKKIWHKWIRYRVFSFYFARLA